MSIINEQAVNSTIPWYKGINGQQWKTLIAGFLGWGLDSFDLIIYYFTIASLIKEWHLTTVETGLIASGSMIASAFGGMIFGILSDKFGRVRSLTLTVLIFSVASGLCALSQNIWQLLFFRCLVGLGLGGEWTAGSTLVSETWPKEHRGKAMSIMQSAYAVGGMIASLIAGPIIAAYGWRVLFFIGILPALLIFYIRRHVKESEIWKSNIEEAKVNKEQSSIFGIFKGNLLKTTIIGTFFTCLVMAGSYPFGVWLPTYLELPIEQGGLGMPVADSSWFVFPLYVGDLVGYLLFGFISDKVGRRKTFAGYLFLACIMVFVAMNVGQSLAIFMLVVFLVGFTGDGCYAGFGAVLSELFPTKLRASGEGFCYNFGRGIGATSVSVVGTLAASIGLRTAIMVPAAFFLLSAFAIFLLPETRGKQFE
jgi:Arabinose efflux permease